MNIANIGLEPKEQYPEMATVKNKIKINKKEKNMRKYSMNVDGFFGFFVVFFCESTNWHVIHSSRKKKKKSNNSNKNDKKTNEMIC